MPAWLVVLVIIGFVSPELHRISHHAQAPEVEDRICRAETPGAHLHDSDLSGGEHSACTLCTRHAPAVFDPGHTIRIVDLPGREWDRHAVSDTWIRNTGASPRAPPKES